MSETFYNDYDFDEFKDFFGDGGAEAKADVPSVGMLWGEFKKRQFPPIEKILFGLSRGQVGMTIASTNLGKTTFALNVALSLAANSPFLPFVQPHNGGRRVMFIDGENTQQELQSDLNLMMRDWFDWERQAVEGNLLTVCDEEINDEPLSLSNLVHYSAVLQRATEFKPDLIVVDTVAALFDLNNENDNAEVKYRVMTPLKNLARAANAVVWFQHHIGKQGEEAAASVNAYRGRGASNFGALSRSVIALTVPDKTERERVTLSVVKAKGYRLDDKVMRLDRDTRWFSVTDEKPPVAVTPLDDVVAYVMENGGAQKADIARAFAGKYGVRTVEGALTDAYNRRLLDKPKRGWYAPPQTAPSASPYGYGGSAETVADEVADLTNVQQSPDDLPN